LTEVLAPPLIEQQPLVILDLETTGGSAMFDRIVEVAAIRIEKGRVVDKLEMLVDPILPIPPFVARLTGISQGMVRGRPRIEDVLDRLDALTKDAVIVAHNATFDYPFVARAFERAGRQWQRSRLCTLKLARRLEPGLLSYRLDRLCAHYRFPYVQSHRAGPDASATVNLTRRLLAEAEANGYKQLEDLLELQDRKLPLKLRPATVDEARIKSIPTGPGVYLLKDERGHVFYVGKSVSLRSRVRQHLRPSGTAAGPGQRRLRKRLRFVADVETIETASELEALLLESQLVKRYLPDANTLLRDHLDASYLRLSLNAKYPRLAATRDVEAGGAEVFGPFRRPGIASRAAHFLNERLGLRQCEGTLPKTACPLLEMKRCLGPCVNQVDDAYRQAAERAHAILLGSDPGFLEELAHERDGYALQLRFEAAAELRDRMSDVEYVIAEHARLQAFADRDVALVELEANGAARLLLVKAGRMVSDTTAPPTVLADSLEARLMETYGDQLRPAVLPEQVDDVLIVDSWLRRRRDAATELPVDRGRLGETAAAIRAALLRPALIAAYTRGPGSFAHGG
jgi:DNA polymerase-3 subunit epsilon